MNWGGGRGRRRREEGGRRDRGGSARRRRYGPGLRQSNGLPADGVTKKTSKFVPPPPPPGEAPPPEQDRGMAGSPPPVRPQPGPTAQTGTAGPSVEPQGAGQPAQRPPELPRATRCQHCPQQETFRGRLRRPRPPIERNPPTSVPSRVLIPLVPAPPGCTPAAGRQLDTAPTPRKSSPPPESKRGCGWNPAEFSSPEAPCRGQADQSRKTHHARGPTSKQANRMKKRNSRRR